VHRCADIHDAGGLGRPQLPQSGWESIDINPWLTCTKHLSYGQRARHEGARRGWKVHSPISCVSRLSHARPHTELRTHRNAEDTGKPLRGTQTGCRSDTALVIAHRSGAIVRTKPLGAPESSTQFNLGAQGRPWLSFNE
jgi:hypothetical protein